MLIREKRDKAIVWIIIGLLVLTALACFIYAYYLCNMLDSQYEAERWAGDSGEPFAQISCFMPADGKLKMTDINKFRTAAAKKLEEASIEISNDKPPFIDCWSCEDSTKVYGEYSGTADVIACGGNFFDFHPLKLVTGNYFSGSDLMQDNVLLDEDLAWLIFGGNDLEGMTVYIYNYPFRVAGVVAREADQATDKAYSGGLGLFMSYDSYMELNTVQPEAEAKDEASEDSSNISKYGISCYEMCMPEPVSGFAYGVAEAEFPKGGEIVQNTGRFELKKLAAIAKDFSVRSIHADVTYSYWENAARYAENKAAMFLAIGAVCCLGPVIIFLILLFRNLAFTNRYIQEDVMPKVLDSVEESIRVRQRARWEKKHRYKEKKE